MKPEITIFWFRRDLRLFDNAGLYHALKSGLPVLPVFIFDREILDDLEDKADRRLEFIHNAVSKLKADLENVGSTLEVHYGFVKDIWKKLLENYSVKKVFTNHDYEPYAIKRDNSVNALLKENGVELCTYKDHVIFEKDEVVKSNGEPYTVFTPYSKAWKLKLNAFYLKKYPTEKYYNNVFKTKPDELISLKEMGFKSTGTIFSPATVKRELIKNYHNTRDVPGVNGTSRLGVHYRFGTVSIREKMANAAELNEKYFNELIWREFYISILWHFPHVVHSSFKPEYDNIRWLNNEEDFHRWCAGQTGYPMVDAGMRELNETGFMHNRVRMVAASFLTKHLLVDWRWGEAYFAAKLLDFELASNNGGWQWAAGCGVDAAPYFRIFNPQLQLEKFDPQLVYIKRWIPEYGTPAYPQPIVDHAFARARCLRVYKEGLAK